VSETELITSSDYPSHHGGRLPGGEAGIVDVAPEQSFWRDAWRRFRRNRLALVGAGFIVLLVVLAILAPVICKYGYADLNTDDRNLPMFSGDHWFGTDRVGHDLFAQVIYGIRVSLRVGFLVAILAGVLGTAFGAVSGYFGGALDTVVMRLVDLFLSIPYFILTVAFVGVIGRGINAVTIALILTGWFVVARVVRSTFLSLKEQEFVQAARALGYGHARIIFRHLLPNALQPVIVYTMLGVGSAILAEAALSFLAIGVLPPTPSWGLLVAQNKGLITTEPHLVFVPGAAIFLTVLAFVFVGDGLRDALDPKLRN
jgi:ABC-type dipeptide/oligopeptide/nickel transport system permease subunit